MEPRKTTSFREYLPSFLLLLVIGAVGLAATLRFMLPTIGPRWLFYFFLVMVVSAIFLPFTYFLNIRFPSKPPAERNVIIRQALWFGIFVAILAWLQLGRALTFPLGVILAAAIILIEMLLRMWERSRWKPE